MRKIGAFVVGALLCAACGGGEEAQKPAMAPPAPEPVAAAPTPASTAPQAAAAPAKPMADLIAASFKNVADAMNAHDAKKFAALYTEDAGLMVAGMPEMHGRTDVEKNAQMFNDGFKDSKFWFSRAWIKGDMAAVEWGWSGTNTGDFMGMKATEKPAGATGVSLVWFTPEGLIKKENRYQDMAAVMTQLGHGKGKARAVPTPAASLESQASKGTPDEDKNIALVKAMDAAWETKKDADFTANLTDDFVFDESGAPDLHKGKAEAKKWFGMFSKAFPDAKSTAATVFGAGDFVVSETVVTGTQNGPLGPLPASKKPVTLHDLAIFQLKDGKIVKGWGFMNNAELLMQVGAMKMPTAGPAAAAAKGDAKADAKGAAKGDAKGATKGEKAAAKPATPAAPAAPAKK